MGSSKCISNREIFYLMLLVQQSGVFWLLPYFLVRGNGTAGLLAVVFGVLAAGCILLVSRYWSVGMPKQGFVTALCCNHSIGGAITGTLFCVWYVLFAILMLYSLVDVIEKQVLPDTPHIVLCASVAGLAGWLSKKGLESIARMNQLCVALLAIMVTVSLIGTVDLFTVEAALPIQIANPTQLQQAAMHSVFCYSSFLSVFMLYPASRAPRSLAFSMAGAVGLGALILTLWTGYALCILGQYSLQTILWIPVHLMRMVQVGTLVDQMESLLLILWMMIVMASGSMFVWCTSEGTHQLIKKQSSSVLHWGIALVVFLGMMTLKNTMGLLQAEALLAKAMVVLLPVMLGLVLFLAPKGRATG